MDKTYLNKKEAEAAIVLARQKGLNNQEIYNELSQQYADKKALALMITGTVRPELKEKYKTLNNILLFLLALGGLANILLIISIAAEEKEPWFLLLLLIGPLFSALFIYAIAKYQASMYRMCGILTFVSVSRGIGNTKDTTEIVISLITGAIVIGLAFYLDSKMFPDYKPNNLTKDANGDYVLDTVAA